MRIEIIGGGVLKKVEAYKLIKSMIISDQLHAESPIDIRQLSTALEMSRTPIHKAFGQLEQEGYIKIVPQVGVYVHRPTWKEIKDRLLLCVAIDVFLAEQAAQNITELQLAELLTILEVMDQINLTPEQVEEKNKQFHSIVVRASNNTYAQKINKSNWDFLNYVNNSLDFFDDISRQESQAEHRMIYYAIASRDVHLTGKLVKHHLMRIVHKISEHYNGTEAKMMVR